jgi:hypothetical protein
VEASSACLRSGEPTRGSSGPFASGLLTGRWVSEQRSKLWPPYAPRLGLSDLGASTGYATPPSTVGPHCLVGRAGWLAALREAQRLARYEEKLLVTCELT